MFPTDTQILIVDDSKIIAEMTAKFLGELGFKNLVYARDGEEALNKLAESQIRGVSFGLIISDWTMPKMNGLSFLKLVRNRAEWAQIPFVFLTSLKQAQDVVTALSSGADSYIIKPLELEVLQKKLEELHKKLTKK